MHRGQSIPGLRASNVAPQDGQVADSLLMASPCRQCDFPAPGKVESLKRKDVKDRHYNTSAAKRRSYTAQGWRARCRFGSGLGAQRFYFRRSPYRGFRRSWRNVMIRAPSNSS
jgi:hypothetical protein